MDQPSSSQKLLSFEFLALCLVIVSAFCNISVFYSFYHYLGTIDIPLPWRGFLVGLEPMSAFILRLLVLPWLHMRNALAVTMASLVLLIAVSCSYLWVTSVPAMIVLRMIHGTVFVLLTSAVIALVVNFIPGEKSGQGFSTLSIATMIPFAVIPPLAEALFPHVRSEADVYAAVSVFSVAAILILLAVRRRIRMAVLGLDGALLRRPAFSEIRENFRLRSVVILLSTIFLVYLAHATVFYFMKDLSLVTGAGAVGLFFSLSMMAMIAVRALGAVLFDRMDKRSTVWKMFALLAPCLLLIPLTSSPVTYYLLAVLYGFSMGVALPLLNALLFSASPPALRGLNTNMTLFTMDAAYFLMPYAGGTLIALGSGFEILFYLAAGHIGLASILMTALGRRETKEATGFSDPVSLHGGKKEGGWRRKKNR